MPGLASAMIAPPSAGPTARARLLPDEFKATAAASCSMATISGVIACQAGSLMAAPRPRRDVSRSSVQGVTAWMSVKARSTAAIAAIHDCMTSARDGDRRHPRCSEAGYQLLQVDIVAHGDNINHAVARPTSPTADELLRSRQHRYRGNDTVSYRSNHVWNATRRIIQQHRNVENDYAGYDAKAVDRSLQRRLAGRPGP